MRHPDSAFNLGTLILWWSHIFVSVLNGCHSIPHIPLPSANFLFCNLIPFPVMSGACSLQGELWYFYCQSSAFPSSLQFRLSLLAWTLLGRPPPRHPFLSHHKIGMIFLQLLLPPIPFNCGHFPNRVFYLYSLSIYHLLWVRNQFYKFQWNAHHQIPVWWAVLTRSACRWFLMPISTHCLTFDSCNCLPYGYMVSRLSIISNLPSSRSSPWIFPSTSFTSLLPILMVWLNDSLPWKDIYWKLCDGGFMWIQVLTDIIAEAILQ